MAKRYEELTIADDFMFGKVMEDKQLCREVLECLLEQPVGELEDVQTERQFRYTTDGKPIRLDVYTRDRNRVYDAEMQNLNHQAVEKLELPRRSRFYQAAMDMDHLDKGRSYRELPEGKVLFICTFDPFGLGYVKYSFQNRCEENQKLCLRDGTEKIFYNCVSSAEEVPEQLKELYDYIRTGRAESALTRKIEEAVGRARRNEEWRSEYMKELLHDDDVREEGRAAGLSEGLDRGRREGLSEGRAEERSMLLTLIPKMTAGGDGDKIAQLENPEVLEAMQRKYGLDFATLQESGKKF